MNRLFEKAGMNHNQFKAEKCFLISTLIIFSISYLSSVVRNAILLNTIMEDMRGQQDECLTNFAYACWTLCTYTLTEFFPYVVIVSLNFRNFRQMAK